MAQKKTKIHDQKNQDGPPHFMDVRQACAFTTMSRRTIDYAKDRGELPFIKKGRKVLFRRGDLIRWLEQDLIDVTCDLERMGG